MLWNKYLPEFYFKKLTIFIHEMTPKCFQKNWKL